MSLLLNALKKAEDGEQTSASSSADDAAAQGVQAAAPPVTPPAAAQPIDLDSMDEAAETKPLGTSSLPPAAADGGVSSAPKKRVHAARIFGASDSSTTHGGGGGGFSKLLYSVLGLALVGGGGYFVLASGFIPGVDLQYIQSLLGQQEQTQIVEARVEPGAQLQVAEDIVLLPVPAVDVQSEVDFSALRLPGNSEEAIGKEAYIKQIAFLTGFDINQERNRKLQEQRELLLDLNLEAVEEEEEAEGIVSSEEEQVVSQEVEIIRTAETSRKVKSSFDSATPSDRELEIVLNGGQRGDSAAEEVKVAQAEPVQIKFSSEGLERRTMIEQARALYYNGSYLEAETIYRSVLVMSPTSRDALRGIAQIAIVTGRYQTAVAAYLDLLGYYPDDPIAIAELTNLRGDNGNFYEIEKALKGALGKIPASDGRLYFALGNLYAKNGKILQAQQSYFEAFTREADNPDYAYNLAVVLDHLNKPALAVRYYQSALSLSKDLPVGFNRAEVEARVNDLN